MCYSGITLGNQSNMSLGYAEKLSFIEDVGNVGMTEHFDPSAILREKVGPLFLHSPSWCYLSSYGLHCCCLPFVPFLVDDDLSYYVQILMLLGFYDYDYPLLLCAVWLICNGSDLVLIKLKFSFCFDNQHAWLWMIMFLLYMVLI